MYKTYHIVSSFLRHYTVTCYIFCNCFSFFSLHIQGYKTTKHTSKSFITRLFNLMLCIFIASNKVNTLSIHTELCTFFLHLSLNSTHCCTALSYAVQNMHVCVYSYQSLLSSANHSPKCAETITWGNKAPQIQCPSSVERSSDLHSRILV